MKRSIILCWAIFSLYNLIAQPKIIETDICIYGGNAAGVIAAYTAAKMNKKVLVVEPGWRLGGLSSGGLGYTDIGNKYVVTGLALDFYRRVGRHYGRFEQWIFEPKVADSIFRDYIKRAGCTVLYDRQLVNVKKNNTSIQSIELESSDHPNGVATIIRAKQFIDCSYEGDLMAKTGVSYTIGREGSSRYGEKYNGVQLRNEHQFPDGVDPYKIPGKPESGLLWGISPEKLQADGTEDNKVQAYNFRICLTNVPDNRIPVTMPEDYDSTRYELLLRFLAVRPAKNLKGFLKMDIMPNRKTDINNMGPFSTDMIGMNYDYPEADYATRKKIITAHERYNKGLLYFIGHDSRMPEHLRKEMLQWGYPKDEYVKTGHWSPQMYVREARRMKGAYIMTEANCLQKEVVTDGVGMAAYSMDSHNAQRVVVNGMVKNEGDVQIHGIHPYPVAYRSLIPKDNECTNLLVPVCLSASHIAYGSIRMEPVFMVLAQSSAVAASMAIDKKNSVQQVDVAALQKELQNNPLADKSAPEIIVDNDAKENISMTGNWKKEKEGGYGSTYLINNSAKDSNATVTFHPVIPRRRLYLDNYRYHIYFYYPTRKPTASAIQVTIFDGKEKTTQTIQRSAIKVEGQTSGEWIHLGTSLLPVGKKAWIAVSNEGADGAVVADAVLLVPLPLPELKKK